jgi:general secretion pathway protein A
MAQTALHAIGTPAATPAAAGDQSSLTYEPYFGLQEKPFSLSADPRFLYRSRAHALAFTELSTAIRRREGLVVLTGEIGTGKTTLCRAVLEGLDRRTFTAFVADPFLSREDLLKILLVEFGVVSLADLKAGHLQGASRQDLSYRLYDFLNSLVPLQAVAVVVVDEAQNLSLPLLEEIRILADLEWQEKLIQVVLVGQPELRSRLKLPQLRQVEQRVSMRCELSALGREDAASYVDHRLNIARGGASTIRFSPESLNVVHHASAGVPRLINLICDRALFEAHKLGATRRIEAAVVWKALGALGLDVTPAKAPQDPGTGLIDIAPIAAPPAPEPPAVVAPVLTSNAPAVAASVLASDAPAVVTPVLARPASDTPVVVAAAVPVSNDLVVAALKPLSIAPAEDTPAPVPLTLSDDAAEIDSIAAFCSEVQHDAPRAEERSVPRSRIRRYALAAGAAASITAGLGAAMWYSDGPIAAWIIGESALPNLPPSPAISAASPGQAVEPAVLPASSGTLAANEPVAAVDVAAATEAYVVEVALFSSGERAARLIGELAARGHSAYAADVTLGTRRFVRVVVGAFATRAEADDALAAIRELPGYDDARVRTASPAR